MEPSAVSPQTEHPGTFTAVQRRRIWNILSPFLEIEMCSKASWSWNDWKGPEKRLGIIYVRYQKTLTAYLLSPLPVTGRVYPTAAESQDGVYGSAAHRQWIEHGVHRRCNYRNSDQGSYHGRSRRIQCPRIPRYVLHPTLCQLSSRSGIRSSITYL